MNRIKKFLYIRKRYDCVKMTLLLSIVLVMLVIYTINAAVDYVIYISYPYELICTTEKTGNVDVLLSDTENINAYSKQAVRTFEINEKTIDVTVLSASYLKDCYDISTDSNLHAVWLNRKYFSELFGKNETSHVHTSCISDGRKIQMSFLLSDNLPNEENYAVMCGQNRDFKESTQLRVSIRKDGTGTEVYELNSEGFQVVNKEQLVISEYELEMLLLKLRFSILTSIVTALAISANLKMYKEKVYQVK